MAGVSSTLGMGRSCIVAVNDTVDMVDAIHSTEGESVVSGVCTTGGCSPVMAIVDDDDDDRVPEKEGGTDILFLLPFLVVTTNYVVPNVIARSPTSPPFSLSYHSWILYLHPVSTLYFPSAPPPTSSTETSVSGVRLAAARSILWTRADFSALRQVYHSPFRLPRDAPILVWFDHEVPVFHRLRSASHKIAPLCGVCVTCPSLATEGPFSNRTGLVGSSIICLGLHAGE